MKKTWKGALALVLALVLSLSLCVPAMAEMKVPEYKGTRTYTNYLALGDSIAAGNGRDGYIAGDHDSLNKFFPSAYPDVVRQSVGVDLDNAFQGARAGWRVREVLTQLGVVEADTFTKDWLPVWCLNNVEPELKETYVNAVANADLITIELGSNEILGNVLWTITKVMYNESIGTDFAGAVQKAIDKVSAMGISVNALQYLLNFAKTMDTINMYGTIVAELLKAPATGVKEFIQYWDVLMEYIYTHNTKNADVVVIGVYNPLNLLLSDSGLTWLSDLVLGPFMDAVKYEMQYGSKYAARYEYVDITDLDISDTKDPSMFHPGDIGHNTIAERTIAALENFNHCQHEHTFKLFRKFATPFKAGYTGDEFCMDCGTFLNQGSIATSHGNIAIPRGLGYAVADKVLNTVGQTVFGIFEKFGK